MIGSSATPVSITSSAVRCRGYRDLGLGANEDVLRFHEGHRQAGNDSSPSAATPRRCAFNELFDSGGWYGYGYGTGVLWVNTGVGQGALVAGDFVFA